MITIEAQRGQFSISAAGVHLRNMEFQIDLQDCTLRSSESVCTVQPEEKIADAVFGPGRLLSYSCAWPEANINAAYRISIFDDIPALSIDLRVINNSGRPVNLKRCTPLALAEDALTLGGGLRDWIIFKNGIRKNEPVSTYRFGGGDGEFNIADVTADGNEDASLTEKNLSGDTLGINSSYLTVLRSVSKGTSFLTGFYTLSHQFSHTQLICDRAESHLRSYEAFCDLDGITLEDGGTMQSEKLLVDFDDSFTAIERYASLAARFCGGKGNRPPITGWCSWYFFYESVTEQDVLNNLEFITAHGLNAGHILIDMGWEERLGTWYPGSKFPHGMKWLADRIHSANLKAGLWLSPFWVEPRSEVHREHPEWLLRNRDGQLIIFNCHIDGYVIDTTIPEACEWIEGVFRRVAVEWGFDLVKIDFLRAVSLYPEAQYSRNVTRAEALRLGMEAVRRGVGDKSFIIACGGHYGPTLGIADANRTSNDIGATWDSFKQTFKKNILRYWMHQKWWINDMDCIIVRGPDEGEPGRISGYPNTSAKGTFTDSEADTIFAVCQAIGGVKLIGDNLPKLAPGKVQKLKALLESGGEGSFIPRDLFSSRYPHILDKNTGNGAHVVTIINWNDTPLVESPALRELIGDVPRGDTRIPEYTIEPHGFRVLSLVE
ncbi:hypothetical protein FACS1894142_4590 [Spirochaetia bacterium]|nr:hypothetical protein FACS1894142_4590 [Spirochaetia bacterium]